MLLLDQFVSDVNLCLQAYKDETNRLRISFEEACAKSPNKPGLLEHRRTIHNEDLERCLVRKKHILKMLLRDLGKALDVSDIFTDTVEEVSLDDLITPDFDADGEKW